MFVPTFDIFAGTPGSLNVLWKEAVPGLGAASERMQQLAAEDPGPYFVFCISSRQVLAVVDTSGQQQQQERRFRRGA